MFRKLDWSFWRDWKRLGIISVVVVLLGWGCWWLLSRRDPQLALPPVPAGDREIVWLMPATSGPNWDRFLQAAQYLVEVTHGQLVWASDPALASSYRDVPAFALTKKGQTGRLWFRWYKLTGDYSADHWLAALLKREPKPLAIIGGSSSDRAVELARHLRRYQHEGASTPALLLTTATADEVEVIPGEGLTNLLEIYPHRSFRFCFTNRQMAETLVDFLAHHPGWLPRDRIWDAITWRDDPYGEDFTNRVSDTLLKLELGRVRKSAVPYSVGDGWLPSRWEREIIGEDLAERWSQSGWGSRILIVPTVERAARRVLIGLSLAAPQAASQTTVLVGDSISFNVVCRDRRSLWPTEFLPMRLVLFAHEEPTRPTSPSPGLAGELVDQITAAAGVLIGNLPSSFPAHSHLWGKHTGTDDLLLWSRILRAVTEAAWSAHDHTWPDQVQSRDQVGGIAADPETFLARLRLTRDERGELFFDEHGNRHLGSGEYVICIQPIRRPNRLDSASLVEIWHRKREAGQPYWHVQTRWLLAHD